jgi:hypothetical protein
MPWLAARLRRLRERSRFSDPVIHLYCLCWNEERMLPFFFRHYDALVERYFIFDNGSTDRSIDLLAQHPKVTLGEFRAAASVIRESPAFYETVWHRSRGGADWVFIVNIDEFLHHPDGKAYFGRCIREGVTVLPAKGYEMIAESFPPPGRDLTDSVTTGIPSAHLDKLCAFRPDAIRRLKYGVGRHTATPRGHVVHPAMVELKLLHYKYLGESYLVERFAELSARIPESDQARKLGVHYFREPQSLREQHRALLARAAPVPGLNISAKASAP